MGLSGTIALEFVWRRTAVAIFHIRILFNLPSQRCAWTDAIT
jgi:hypothetical protein